MLCVGWVRHSPRRVHHHLLRVRVHRSHRVLIHQLHRHVHQESVVCNFGCFLKTFLDYRVEKIALKIVILPKDLFSLQFCAASEGLSFVTVLKFKLA